MAVCSTEHSETFPALITFVGSKLTNLVVKDISKYQRGALSSSAQVLYVHDSVIASRAINVQNHKNLIFFRPEINQLIIITLADAVRKISLSVSTFDASLA